MSYNIDTFKLKKIENFNIPLDSFFKHERTDWHPTIERQEDGSLVICSGSDSIKLHGAITNGMFHCTHLSCHGEGSGTFMHWILEPAFGDSTGELIASCVWEGGDSINQLRVKDGNVTWVDIDI